MAMSNVASERVVNGIKTRVLHGKDYVEVAERLRILHDLKKEFEVIESQPYQVADRWVWRVVALIDEKRYVGNAEVKLNAPKGTVDATNPFENAETSALGRLLAFAGLGTVESIASFDEVYRAISLEQGGRPVIEAAPASRQLPQPEADETSVPTVKALQDRCAALCGTGYWQAMVLKALKREEPIRERDLRAMLCQQIALADRFLTLERFKHHRLPVADATQCSAAILQRFDGRHRCLVGLRLGNVSHFGSLGYTSLDKRLALLVFLTLLLG